MTDITLTMAVGDYEHVRELSGGRIVVPGLQLTMLHPTVEQIFQRFHAHREWEVSEFSFAKFVSMVASGDDSLVAIPVFPSRLFRHSSVYVSSSSRISSPEQLAGGRIGIPEWAQTAAVYSRGFLEDDYGVSLRSVTWVQGGVNEPGRRERAHIELPEGVVYQRVLDRSLNDMLVAGDLDAVLSARPPVGLREGSVRRLFADYPQVEREYYRRTQVYPIMHVIVIRRDVYERSPWVARNLFEAFDAAKEIGTARLGDVTASWVPLPWTAAWADDALELFGGDPWPYGVEPNRPTLEAFLRMAHEQGVAATRLEPEDLFVASAISQVVV